MVDRQDALGFPLAKPLDEVDVQGLAVALRGDLIRSEDDRYDTARAVFNAMVDRRPALIVRCAGVSDVMSVLEPFMEKIRATPKLRWSVVQRNFWVHGVDSLSEFLKVSVDYTLKEAAGQIRCPTLLGWSESDPLSWNAQRIYDALRPPKELVRFMNAEGAGDHCEVRARALFDQRAFDWLDRILA